MQRGDAGARQVVGVDVVGVDVVGGGEHRRAARQALARIAAGAVERIDAGNAQDASRRRRCCGRTSAGALRHRRGGARARWPARSGRVSSTRVAAAVAVDAAGRAVDEAAQARRARERAHADARCAGRRRPSAAGGARCSTASARPARRASVAGRSRSPSSGTMPARAQRGDARRRSTSAPARASGRASRRATRRPTSPQPTISSTGLLKRVGRSGTANEWARGRIRGIDRHGQNRGPSLGDAPASPSPDPMAFTVTVQPSGRTFSVERDEPILQRRDPPGHRPALRLQGRRLRLVQVPDARRPRHPRRASAEGAQPRGRSRRA